MPLHINITFTNSPLALLFMRLAKRFCVQGFTDDYLTQAIECEKAGMGRD